MALSFILCLLSQLSLVALSYLYITVSHFCFSFYFIDIPLFTLYLFFPRFLYLTFIPHFSLSSWRLIVPPYLFILHFSCFTFLIYRFLNGVFSSIFYLHPVFSLTSHSSSHVSLLTFFFLVHRSPNLLYSFYSPYFLNL